MRLKIDGRFVRAAPDDEADARIVTALAGLADGPGPARRGRRCRDRQQLDFVKHCGCDEAQGYHLSRALPRDQFEQFARQRA